MTTSVTRIVFHKTTPELQDRFFLVSDRSCPKADGLRPHHWYVRNLVTRPVSKLWHEKA